MQRIENCRLRWLAWQSQECQGGHKSRKIAVYCVIKSYTGGTRRCATRLVEFQESAYERRGLPPVQDEHRHRASLKRWAIRAGNGSFNDKRCGRQVRVKTSEKQCWVGARLPLESSVPVVRLEQKIDIKPRCVSLQTHRKEAPRQVHVPFLLPLERQHKKGECMWALWSAPLLTGPLQKLLPQRLLQQASGQAGG